MPINQNEIVDLLYKKVAFNSAKTDTEAARSASEEPIVSPVSAYGNHVWVSAGNIPGTPPTEDSQIVKRQQSSDGEHIQLTLNPDVATHRSWLALSNNNATQMLNWIPPIFGAQYGLKVWIGDPTQLGAYRIYPKGSGRDDQFYFDYNAGALHFIGQELPQGISAASQIFIEGYRYIGSTDLSNLQATALNDLSDVTIDNLALNDGQVLQWSQNQNQWISGPVSGGAMEEFLITPPKLEGQTLVYEAVDAGGLAVNKFKNEFLNYSYLDGLPGATNAHAGRYLRATASGTSTNPDVMELDWHELTDLYTPLGVIDIASSNIFHLDASRATDLDPSNPATGQDVIVTTDPARTELPDNSAYDPNRHGAKYLADPQLWVMKTTELDKHGHVLGRVWTNLSDTFDGYVKQEDYDLKWTQHESGMSPRHDLWTDLAGVHSQMQTPAQRNKLMVRDDEGLLNSLSHPGITIAGGAITEIYSTHLTGKPIPDSSSTPSDLDVLAYSAAQDRWILSNIASGQGQANEGTNLSGADTNAFQIYDGMDAEFFRFRGIKAYDANNSVITDWDHTWNNGIDEDLAYPFLVRQNPGNNTIDFKFDASKIKIYELAERLSPGNIGYSLKQLKDWSSAESEINPPDHANGINTIFGKAYARGWFSNPKDSSTPNQMSQLEWAALMGGGLEGVDDPGRRLRTSHRPYYATNDPGQPTSIQQQIDDKVQLSFFRNHFTLGGRAEEIRNLNFGGYYDVNGNYGFPRTVETTEGLTNPIYEGTGWAHEAQSIIFRAGHLSHAGAGTWGDTYNNNWGDNAPPEWATHGIHKWNWGGGDETYHTVKSVISRHILTHAGNPHGVTHLEVGSETAQWNANKIQGTNVSFSGLENNHIMVWDGSQWINSDIMTQSGESNAAENIGAAGVGTYLTKAGSVLQFKKLKSNSPEINISSTGNTVDFDFDESTINVENLTGFPFEINKLSNVNVPNPLENHVLTYHGGEWIPAYPPGMTDFEYDGTGADEEFSLRAEEVLDPNTGTSYVPKKWKWVPYDARYTTANKLAGLAHSVSGIIQTGNLEINYEDIADGYIMKWNGTSWVASVNPAIEGSGEINRIGSWADSDLGSLTSSTGTTLACTTINLAGGGTLDASKQTVDVDGVSTVRLMVKTVVPTAYVEVDTAVSNAKEIGFTINEDQIQLDNLGGDLNPLRITPNNVNSQAFGALAAYDGENIGVRFGDNETELVRLEDDKLDITVFEEHEAYDNTKRPGDYTVGYGPIVDPGNTFGQTIIPDDPDLKHQPYEIGHSKPVFNASRIMNAPIDQNFIISDGQEGISTLGMGDAGRYMQWDGFQWTIGGGGEISTGEHMQFAYYYAHTPSVNTTTQILKPVGNAFNFVEGTGLVESKIGMHTTTPHASLSIAGSSPSLGLKQIGNAINEPDLEAGWGTLYARSSAGGITAESIIVLHFDGADGGNSFLNYGNADLFFLPQHDPDGNGIYDSVNNVRTKAERNIYGGTSGYFPGGPGDYLAAPAVDKINLAKKPFSIDFWMCPQPENPGEQLKGKQILCGQFDGLESYWYLAINYENEDTAEADTHYIEFCWKEFDGNQTSQLHNRNLTRVNSDAFTPDTWYHVVFQRVPAETTDTWELLIAEATPGHQVGVPVSNNTGLTHNVTQLGPIVQLDIDQYDSDFLIGNFCRQENISVGNDWNSFNGYIDEFRFQIGTYINWVGLSQGGYYLTYLLPYDTGNSALIFKDDLGTYDLLNTAGIVRRLTDQDGDTRLDVDTDDNNDNHIRLITSAVEIASFSQLGMSLANTDVRVSTIKDDLNNSFSSALVTQKAVKEAIDNISTKSIEDTVGTTYVHTEQTTNDYAIRMAVQGNEKLVIDSNFIDLKSPLKAYGVAGDEGEVLIVAADGSLTWGTPGAGNVATGTTGTMVMYTDDAIDLGPATGMTFNSDQVNEENTYLQLKGKEKLHYLNIEEDDFLSDTADVYIQNDGDGNDEFTKILWHFDDFSPSHSSSDYQGNGNGFGPANSSHGEDTTFKKFGNSSWRSGSFDSNGNLTGYGNLSTGQYATPGYIIGPNTTDDWTFDFWIRPHTSYWEEAANMLGSDHHYLLEDSVIFELSGEGRRGFGMYADQRSGGDSVGIKVRLKENTPTEFVGNAKVGEWSHIAIMRKGTVLHAFVNGYPVYSVDKGSPTANHSAWGNGTFSLGNTFWASARPGHNGSGNSPTAPEFIGHIDEFRVSSIARYDHINGFVPRDTPYGTKETSLMVHGRDDLKLDALETNRANVLSTGLIHENELVKGHGSSPRTITDSGIYAVDGSLGIGTSTPASKLEVAGSLKAIEASIIEGEAPQPGLLLRTYGGCSWDPSAPHSSTNPTWTDPSDSTTVWNIIRSGNHGSAVGPDARIGAHCRWTGYWICPETRTWTFGINAQNTGWLRIDGVMVVHDNYGFDRTTANINGVAGRVYAIDVQKMNDGWPHDFWFDWKHDGMANFSDDLTGMFVTEYPILNTNRSNRDQPASFNVPRVGIGTSQPTEALEVLGTVKAAKFAGEFEGTFSAGVHSSIQNSIVGTNPTGAVIAYAGSSAPTGWLLCDGQAVDRTTYASLYTVTGDTHGAGDGSTTFNLPDYNNSGFAGPQIYIIKT